MPTAGSAALPAQGGCLSVAWSVGHCSTETICCLPTEEPNENSFLKMHLQSLHHPLGKPQEENGCLCLGLFANVFWGGKLYILEKTQNTVLAPLLEKHANILSFQV